MCSSWWIVFLAHFSHITLRSNNIKKNYTRFIKGSIIWMIMIIKIDANNNDPTVFSWWAFSECVYTTNTITLITHFSIFWIIFCAHTNFSLDFLFYFVALSNWEGERNSETANEIGRLEIKREWNERKFTLRVCTIAVSPKGITCMIPIDRSQNHNGNYTFVTYDGDYMHDWSECTLYTNEWVNTGKRGTANHQSDPILWQREQMRELESGNVTSARKRKMIIAEAEKQITFHFGFTGNNFICVQWFYYTYSMLFSWNSI